jgi:hypothetical protein
LNIQIGLTICKSNLMSVPQGRNPIGDPLYGKPSQPTNRLPVQNQTGNVNSGARPGEPNADLNRSYNQLNNTYLDENSWRGDGANVISDRLNFGGGKTIIQGEPQIQYIPKEIITEVYEEEYAPSKISSLAPTVTYDDTININGKNILAESMAKVSLLIMENNRLRWLESQRNAELARLKSAPVQIAVPIKPIIPTRVVVEAPPACPTCQRPYPAGWTGPHISSVPVRTSNTYVSGAQTNVTRVSGTTPVIGGQTSTYPGSTTGVGARPVSTFGPSSTTQQTNSSTHPGTTYSGQQGTIRTSVQQGTTTISGQPSSYITQGGQLSGQQTISGQPSGQTINRQGSIQVTQAGQPSSYTTQGGQLSGQQTFGSQPSGQTINRQGSTQVTQAGQPSSYTTQPSQPSGQQTFGARPSGQQTTNGQQPGQSAAFVSQLGNGQ